MAERHRRISCLGLRISCISPKRPARHAAGACHLNTPKSLPRFPSNLVFRSNLRPPQAAIFSGYLIRPFGCEREWWRGGLPEGEIEHESVEPWYSEVYALGTELLGETLVVLAEEAGFGCVVEGDEDGCAADAYVAFDASEDGVGEVCGVPDPLRLLLSPRAPVGGSRPLPLLWPPAVRTPNALHTASPRPKCALPTCYASSLPQLTPMPFPRSVALRRRTTG